MHGPRVLVIGAGFGGLSAAHALRQQGIEQVTILERGADVGGVWRDNTYPGAACDVPSPLYSWSWAVNPHWSHRYSGQAEILDYVRRTAREEDLLSLVRFGQSVTSCTYDEQAATWTVRTAEGATFECDLLVPAVGQLSEPVVPDLPGVETFAGPAFHSAAWRHDVPLDGARVVVVGTGASAIQFVPGIVDRVGSMTVLQRSAPYVMPKPDTEYGGLHHRLADRVPATVWGERRATYGLTELYNLALGGRSVASAPLLKTLELVWRAQLRRQVPSAALRALLTPSDPIGCKRLLFSNDWYPALARDHVTVTTEKAVAVTPTGVTLADGTTVEADVLVWGTGFAATSFLRGISVVGRGGADLHDVWAGGAAAYLGLAVPGFPNLACMYGPNTNLGGSSIIQMLEAQAAWVAQVARALADGRARSVEVRPAAYAAYDAEMQERLGDTPWARCDNWYSDGGRITTNWPGLVKEYQDRLRRVEFADLVLEPA
jgi:cation diffusion facilitator CzcD-associated flavoprotein CzcO